LSLRTVPYLRSLHPPTHLPHFHPVPTRRSSDLVNFIRHPAPPTRAPPPRSPPTKSVRRRTPPRSPSAAPAPAPNSAARAGAAEGDRKSTRLNSSHQIISYAVFCLKKKNTTKAHT